MTTTPTPHQRSTPSTIEGRTAQHIAASVRVQIESGLVSPGTTLPPIRQLAAEIGINRNTVAAAYSQLAASGLVQTRRRGGTVVLGPLPPDGEGQSAHADQVNLADGNPDPALLPPLELGVLATRAPSLYGEEPVLSDLTGWAQRHLSPDIGAPHRTLLSHGAVDAVERVLGAWLSRGDVVAVEDPCFLSSIGTLRLGGYRSIAVPVDRHGITPDGLRAALAAGARALVCTPRAHNPTGASITETRAASLRAILQRAPEVLVIEDDHFSLLSRAAYARITPVETPRWALVRTVSKFLGPDLRVAFVAADEQTCARLETRLNAGTNWVSHVLQRLVSAQLQHPEFTDRMLYAARTYAERADRLVDAVGRTGKVGGFGGAGRFGGNGVETVQRPDGLNVWIPVHGNPSRVVELLGERGWSVRAGHAFAVGRSPQRTIRVTTSTMTAEQCDAFTRDLSRVD